MNSAFYHMVYFVVSIKKTFVKIKYRNKKLLYVKDKKNACFARQFTNTFQTALAFIFYSKLNKDMFSKNPN